MTADMKQLDGRDGANVRIFALAFAGLAFVCVGIGSVYVYYEIIRQESILVDLKMNTDMGPSALYLYVIQLSVLFAERYIPLLFISFFAFSFTRASIRFVKSSDYNRTSVVPPRDLLIIEDAIKQGKPEPIDQYIRIASLAGGIGLFQKIGLTGLPLTTLALVVFFSLGVLFTDNQTETFKAFLDFTKLTLGAFIGSFVQRQVERRGQESDIQRAVQSAAQAQQNATQTPPSAGLGTASATPASASLSDTISPHAEPPVNTDPRAPGGALGAT